MASDIDVSVLNSVALQASRNLFPASASIPKQPAWAKANGWRNAAEEARKVQNWLQGQASSVQAQTDAPPSQPATYHHRPPFPDPETADIGEAERRREHLASAAYQERHQRLVEWEQKRRAAEVYQRFRAQQKN